MCLYLIHILIKSAMARAQRDAKVTLCHFLWMANHAHLLAVFHDAQQAMKFHMEVKKKITDYMKRLLGLKQLALWEEKDSIPEVLDYEAVIDQIIYLYCNPARANLVESIVEYPGLSSWSMYNRTPATFDAEVKEEVHWIRQPAIVPLKKRRLTKAEDRAYAAQLIEKCPRTYDLVLKPNAWMKCFGVMDSEVEQINQEIRERIGQQERQYSQERTGSVKGAEELRGERIMKPWTPKPRERRIFVISRDRKLRVEFIKLRKAIFRRCQELYLIVCQGGRVEWPPGVFPAAPPILSNAVSFT